MGRTGKSAVPILLLGATLVLPSPGTDSRSRGFCREWLGLSRPAKHDVLLRAAETEPGFDAECRAGRSGPLAHALDQECKNWSRLMDFEVRAYVDRLLATCRTNPEKNS